MGGSKLVVSLALAAFAMAGVVRPAVAPHAHVPHPSYAPDHRIHLEPTMGIRGDATVLPFPVRA